MLYLSVCSWWKCNSLCDLRSLSWLFEETKEVGAVVHFIVCQMTACLIDFILTNTQDESREPLDGQLMMTLICTLYGIYHNGEFNLTNDLQINNSSLCHVLSIFDHIYSSSGSLFQVSVSSTTYYGFTATPQPRIVTWQVLMYMEASDWCLVTLTLSFAWIMSYIFPCHVTDIIIMSCYSGFTFVFSCYAQTSSLRGMGHQPSQ